MKQRNLVFVTVMSLITLGIYDIYWAFSTRNELVKKGQKVPSPLIVLVPLLGLLLIAALQIISHLAYSGGSVVLDVVSVIIGIFAVLAIIPMGIYWLWRYSQAVEKVTKGDLTHDVSFVIALVTGIIGFGFIWPIVVQYYFNKQNR